MALLDGHDEALHLAVRQALDALGQGWVLDVYSTATEAMLRVASSNPPHVLLLDDTAAGRSGIDCAARLTALLSKVRVLFLTERPNKLQVTRLLMAGAVGYLLKPVAAEDLVRAIVRAAQGGLALSETAERALMRWCRGVGKDPRFEQLSDREWDVMLGLLQGLKEGEIATSLGVEISTVHTHRKHLQKDLKIRSREELIKVFLSRNDQQDT
jgi:DNA-binding NarL/FixJ family response regulator